jgi:hypothetical protein
MPLLRVLGKWTKIAISMKAVENKWSIEDAAPFLCRITAVDAKRAN